MNERKIAIDGIRETKWQLYKVGEFEFVKDIEGKEDIQIKKKNEEINQCKGEKNVELMGKSMIKVTMDKPEIEEILKCSLNLHKKEVKLGEGKIYFGCYCKVEVLYKGKDCDDILVLQDDVYLSKEEELVGVNSDMMTTNDVDIVNYDSIVTPDDLGENRIVNIEFVVKGNIRVLSKEIVEFIVFMRENKPVNLDSLKSNGYNFRLSKMNFYDISSTELRKLIQNGKSVSGFLTQDVEEYIKENGLYRD